MITAAVTVLVAGFSMGIGYIWGAREATNTAIAEIQDYWDKEDEVNG